ncbi:MAG TPA: DUF3263 domain-containing protein [Pilimelia sp.]|nr:DUF3263 domain-containing protein [Pilimelia sp.]
MHGRPPPDGVPRGLADGAHVVDGDGDGAPGTGAAPVAGGDGADDGGLSARDLAVLAFERRWWRHPGAKEQAIREEFGLSAVRYYQVLRALLDRPAALAHDPVLVGRLRRLRTGHGRGRPVDRVVISPE